MNVSPLAVNADREHVMDFVHAFYADYMVGLYKKPVDYNKVIS